MNPNEIKINYRCIQSIHWTSLLANITKPKKQTNRCLKTIWNFGTTTVFTQIPSQHFVNFENNINKARDLGWPRLHTCAYGNELNAKLMNTKHAKCFQLDCRPSELPGFSIREQERAVVTSALFSWCLSVCRTFPARSENSPVGFSSVATDRQVIN